MVEISYRQWIESKPDSCYPNPRDNVNTSSGAKWRLSRAAIAYPPESLSCSEFCQTFKILVLRRPTLCPSYGQALTQSLTCGPTKLGTDSNRVILPRNATKSNIRDAEEENYPGPRRCCRRRCRQRRDGGYLRWLRAT